MLSARFFLVFGSKLPLFADNGKFSTVKNVFLPIEERFERCEIFFAGLEIIINFAPTILTCEALQAEIKRESGENPEQSRCCKFHEIVSFHTICHW